MALSFDNALIEKAVSALLRHEEKKASEKSTSLFGGYAKPVQVQVQLLSEIKRPVTKPIRIAIPHSLLPENADDYSVCLFCRSDDKEGLQSYLADSGIEGINTVLSINQIKKIVDRFEDKKKLLAEHTHFVCDARIVPQLYNLLGKVFAARNNYPIPVNINLQKSQRIPVEIAKVLNATYFNLKGKNVTIRMGHSDMIQEHITANIQQGLSFVVGRFPGGMQSIHSIHVKTADSVALPIYHKVASQVVESMGKQSSSKKASSGAAKKGAKTPVKKSIQKEKGDGSSGDSSSPAQVSSKRGRKSTATNPASDEVSNDNDDDGIDEKTSATPAKKKAASSKKTPAKITPAKSTRTLRSRKA
jgi:ribosome biogenesis protein UTP30